MEILAPVKDYNNCKVAVNSGCDAIYFAGNFGARKTATNQVEENVRVIEYAKKRNVKCYMTFNIIIHNSEVNEFLEEINTYYNLGIDGVILQDPSFIKLLSEHYPDLAVHCSTQMNVSNVLAANFVSTLGAERVVMPRELTLDEIKYIKDKTNVEVEVFVHGALCVSLSGNCYHSVLLDDKSANRGSCSQYCRMISDIYCGDNLVSNSDYMLNLKDLNSIDNIDAFERAGVDSLKIEGRLKDRDYVFKTVSSYKHGKNFDLEKVYNREHSKGFVGSVPSKYMQNYDRPNNTGFKIGNVIECIPNNSDKLGYYEYKILIDTREVIEHDHLRFVSDDFEDGLIVEKMDKGKGGMYIYSTYEVLPGLEVFKVKTKSIDFELNNLKDKKVNVGIDFQIMDSKLLLYVNGNYVESDFTFDIAQKNPISEQFLVDNFTFEFANVFINNFEVDNDYFVPLSILKKIKKLVIKSQINPRNKEALTLELASYSNDEEGKLFIEVRSDKQYEYAKGIENTVVIVNNYDNYAPEDYILLPKSMRDEDFEDLKEVFNDHNNFVISDLGALKHLKEKNIIANFNLNVTNFNYQQFLRDNKVKYHLLTPEAIECVSDDSIELVYGRVPTMLLTYCPINQTKTNRCDGCKICHSGKYTMRDKLERRFPLLYEGNDKLGMYSNKPLENTKPTAKNKYIRLTTEETFVNINVFTKL